MQLLGSLQETEPRPATEPTVGVATVVNLVPLQASTTGLAASEPTARQRSVAGHATALRLVKAAPTGSTGLRTVQLVPSVASANGDVAVTPV
jgi:hypothetical protein